MEIYEIDVNLWEGGGEKPRFFLTTNGEDNFFCDEPNSTRLNLLRRKEDETKYPVDT